MFHAFRLAWDYYFEVRYFRMFCSLNFYIKSLKFFPFYCDVAFVFSIPGAKVVVFICVPTVPILIILKNSQLVTLYCRPTHGGNLSSFLSLALRLFRPSSSFITYPHTNSHQAQKNCTGKNFKNEFCKINMVFIQTKNYNISKSNLHFYGQFFSPSSFCQCLGGGGGTQYSH